MRNTVIGLVVGVVLGVILGATVIAPRLQRAAPGTVRGVEIPAQTPAEIAKQLPRALVARPAVSLKMASGFPLDTPIAGELAKRIDSRIWEVSHGQIEIRSYPPGALASATDLFEAAGSGAIDAAFAPPGVAGDTVPSLQIFSGVPFGPPADEFLAWFEFGGGRVLLDEINGEHNIHGLLCGLLPPSAFGWFRRELQSAEDLKGLRMDAEGLGGRVLARLGVDVLHLATADLMMGLEQGGVDAVAYGSPAMDRRMEFGAWLKNYYPQGWSQSLTMLELMINLKKWEQLDTAQQAQIETLCGDNVRHSLAEGEAVQFLALKEMYAAGVRLQRLPPGIRDALEQAWPQVVQQASSEDPEFRRVWESLSAFRGDFAVWRELSRP